MSAQALGDFRRQIDDLIGKWEGTGLAKRVREELPLLKEDKGKLEAANRLLVDLGITDDKGEPKPITKDTKITVDQVQAIVDLGITDEKGNPITKDTEITVDQFIKLVAKKINTDIDNLIRVELQSRESQGHESYLIQLIQIRTAQLAKLVEYAQKNTLEGEEIKKALFNNNPTFRVSEALLTRFFATAAREIVTPLLRRITEEMSSPKPVHTTTPKVPPPPPPLPTTPAPKLQTKLPESPALPTSPTPDIQTTQTKPPAASSEHAQTIEKLPKWLKEITDLAVSEKKDKLLHNQYRTYSAYDNKDNIDDRLSNLMQKRLAPSKTRIEQLKLMEDTLKLLEKSGYSVEKKTKIARGLMLVIKHQIEHEDNRFKSRMGNMVDKYINSTDETEHTLSATECIDEFKIFSKKLTTTAKMKDSIEKAVEDNSWQETKTLFYESHQKIDAIQQAIAAVLVHEDTPAGEFSKMHAALNNGTGRKSISPSVNTLIAEAISNIETNLISSNVISLAASSENFARIHLSKIQETITDYRYLIKIAEEQYKIVGKRYAKSRNPKDEAALRETKESLKLLTEKLTLLDKECKKFIAASKLKKIPEKEPTPEVESQTKAKSRFALPSLFEHSKITKAGAKKEMSKLRIRIEASILHLPTTENSSDSAAKKYSAMRASLTKNLSASKLQKQIEMLTDDTKDNSIPKNIEALQTLLSTADTPKEEISSSLRRIEQQLKTLAYLTEIAELKLDPSVNVVRRVSTSQAKKLGEAFAKPKFLEQLTEFEGLRTDLKEKFGITPEPGSKL